MKSIIKDIIIVVVIVLAITFFVKPIIVKGISMEPTLIENNYIFISKQAYKFGEPKHKDIVVFPHEEGIEKELYIKRVIGIPGDIIEVKNDKVYRNHKELKEPYIKDGVTSGEIPETKIKKGEIFVMGDNRLNSSDSRYFGPVPIDKVTGKAFIRLFPFNKIGLL
ncbi:MAG: signal peptidase I [Anaerovoracaceae bacterium]